MLIDLWRDTKKSGHVLLVLPCFGRRWVCAAYSVLSVLTMAGCATFHDRPVTAASSATSLQQRSLRSSALKLFLVRHGVDVHDWPLPQWSVNGLTLAARFYHPGLAVARERWRKALGAVRMARAYPNPSIDLTPKYTTNVVTGESPWTIDSSAAVELITAGKRSDRVAAAQANAEAARYSYQEARWRNDGDVRRAWLDLTAARQRQPLLDAQVHDTQSILDAVSAAVKVGESSPFEAFAARKAWNKAVDAQNAGHAAVAKSMQALASAVGIPVAALVNVRLRPGSEAVQDRPLPSNAKLQTWVLTQRADVRAAVLRYAESQLQLKLAIAQQYPDLNLGPGYEWDQGAHRWSLGVSLNLPVFNQNQGGIAMARAERAARADQLHALQLKLVGHLEDALTAFRTAHLAMDLAKGRVHDSRRRVQDDRAALDAGQIAQTTWLRDRLAFTQDELNLIDAHTRLRRTHLGIATLIEHPLASDAAPRARRDSSMSTSVENDP